jgi:alkyl hydroperoxide reductase subunit D
MSIENLKDSLPEYAKDLKLNLSSLLTTSDLTEQQLWGSILAAALASRNANVIKVINEECKQHLNEAALNAVKAAAAIMAMNNIYYRFTHLASNKEYSTMPAGLRMNILANHGVDKADFEMWSLVVSAINGCSACMDAHEKQLLKHGLSISSVQDAVRVASIVHAVAVTLENAESL